MEETEQKTKLTILNENLLKKMILNTKETIFEVCQKNEKILFFFPCSLGCPYCQGTLEDLYKSISDDSEEENFLPIILHDEDEKNFKLFIDFNERTKKFSNLKHIQRKDFIKEFIIEKEKFELNIWNFAKNGISEYRRLSGLGISPIYEIITKEANSILPCIFIIKDFKICFEYRKTNKYQRFDFDLIKNFDLEIEIKMNDLEEDDFCFIETIKKKKKNQKKNQEIFQKINENLNSSSSSSLVLSEVPMLETERSSFEFQTYIRSIKRISSNKSLDWNSDEEELQFDDDDEDDELIDHPDILNHLNNIKF